MLFPISEFFVFCFLQRAQYGIDESCYFAYKEVLNAHKCLPSAAIQFYTTERDEFCSSYKMH